MPISFSKHSTGNSNGWPSGTGLIWLRPIQQLVSQVVKITVTIIPAHRTQRETQDFMARNGIHLIKKVSYH